MASSVAEEGSRASGGGGGGGGSAGNGGGSGVGTSGSHTGLTGSVGLAIGGRDGHNDNRNGGDSGLMHTSGGLDHSFAAMQHHANPQYAGTTSSTTMSDASSLSNAEIQAHLIHLQQQGIQLYGSPELLQNMQANFLPGSHAPQDGHSLHQQMQAIRSAEQNQDMTTAAAATSISQQQQRQQGQPPLPDFSLSAGLAHPSSFMPTHLNNAQQSHQYMHFDARDMHTHPNNHQEMQIPHSLNAFQQMHQQQPHQTQSHMSQAHLPSQTFEEQAQRAAQQHLGNTTLSASSSQHTDVSQTQQFQVPTELNGMQLLDTVGPHNSNGTRDSISSAHAMQTFLQQQQQSSPSRRHSGNTVHASSSSSDVSSSDVMLQFQQHQQMLRSQHPQQHQFSVSEHDRHTSSQGGQQQQQVDFTMQSATDLGQDARLNRSAEFHRRAVDKRSFEELQDQQHNFGTYEAMYFGRRNGHAAAHLPQQIAQMQGQSQPAQQSSRHPYDLTDQKLSAALASNANITSSPSTGSLRRQSQQSLHAHQQGNTTPTIMEEDEHVFHRQQQQQQQQQHPGIIEDVGQYQPQQQQSQPYDVAEASASSQSPFFGSQAGQSDASPVTGLGLVARRTHPHLRPNIYQQYSNMNLSSFEDTRFRDTGDCLPFIDEVMFNYLSSSSRLGMGERTVMVMASKVAQKSYGAEKRFLCPPPMVLLVGSSWWSACKHTENRITPQISGAADDAAPTVLTPPRLNISLSGDGAAPAQEGALDWASSSGKLIDTDNPSSEFAISGRSIGRHLFINDSDEKRRHCEALFHISVPTASASDRRPLGVFSSKPIKVISKPSKKRQSSRNSELGVNHGSTISLFHRLRSQTVSTRYLCVSGAPTWFKGSDGVPFLNTDANTHIPKQGESPSCFVAKTSSWDPFIVYLVNPHMNANDTSQQQQQSFQASNQQRSNGRPSHYPSPPINALPFSHGNTPIHYNQPVVLQCLNTAVVSPVMVIRKADRGTTVSGSGHPFASFGPNGPPPGNTYGEPVSQLHKVAFEILEEGPQASYSTSSDASGPGQSGHFLGCLNEDVGLRKPLSARQWALAHTLGGMANVGIGSGIPGGRSSSQSRPSTPTTPVTPMTAQIPSSASSTQMMNAGMGGGGYAGGGMGDAYKMDPSQSPTSAISATAAYAPAHSRVLSSGSSGSGGGSGMLSNAMAMQQHTAMGQAAPYSYGSQLPYAPQGQMQTADESSGGGKVKRPRRVSSSSLVPQKNSTGAAGKGRRRGQSLSVVGLQNQLFAQQQQKEQQQQQAQAAAAAGGGFPSSTPYGGGGFGSHRSASSSSSLTSALPGSSGMAGTSSTHSTSTGSGTLLRRTSSFANSVSNSESSSFSLPISGVGGASSSMSMAWTVDVHDSDIWTIVGVDIARHTFYLPPKLVGGSNANAEGVDASVAHLVTVPAPAMPITPLPAVYKYTGGKQGAGLTSASSPVAEQEQSYLTLVGANLTPDLFIYFGDWRSTHVSVTSASTILCASPPALEESGLPRHRAPITLVRRDGVIFPTDCIYDP